MERLKTEDCTEVPTSLASPNRLMTAAGYIVTTGPKAKPHRKNAPCDIAVTPPTVMMKGADEEQVTYGDLSQIQENGIPMILMI